MVLVDTSVWIHFFRNDDHAAVRSFTGLLEDDRVVICPIIFQEILQGIQRDTQFRTVKDLLPALSCLKADPIEAAIGAASLYRNLKRSGMTIRKSNDCLIAWYAISSGIPLLAADTDFEFIAQGSSLKIYSPLR